MTAVTMNWKITLPLLLFIWADSLYAQTTPSGIAGITMDSLTSSPVPFVHIRLYTAGDTVLLSAGISDENGAFEFQDLKAGSYELHFRAMGYHFRKISLDVRHQQDDRVIPVTLVEDERELQEFVVRGTRDLGETTLDRNVFHIQGKMVDASYSGLDILNYIPGIQVNLMQEIQVEGSSEILILVDGRERDRNYLRQLSAQQIEKVELMTSPPAQYEGTAERVIQLVLKKTGKAGLDGHLNLEAPTRRSEIYVFPSGRISYGAGKINLFASYDGDFRYFDVVDQVHRKATAIGQENWTLDSRQYVRQENWSHRFHYGVDYFLHPNHQVNFYGYYNPYSQEYNGISQLEFAGGDTVRWDARKEDHNRNKGSYYSVFYKWASPDTPSHQLTLDAGFHRFRSVQLTRFVPTDTNQAFTNHLLPKQNSYSIRIDYKRPIGKKFKLAGGLQHKLLDMMDRNGEGFRFGSRQQGYYSSIGYAGKSIQLEAGLRIEIADLGMDHEGSGKFTSYLPNISSSIRLGEESNLKLTYRKHLGYPSLYHLNPYGIMPDPYSLVEGNPLLKPAMNTELGMEYSRNFSGNWFSLRTFYARNNDVINLVGSLDKDRIFRSVWANLGDISRLGMQVNGSYTLGEKISIQQFAKISRLTATARDGFYPELGTRQRFAYEIGLTGIVSLPYSFTASAQLSYTSPLLEVQRTLYSDPLYFLALEKEFGIPLKAGITTALPFGRNFIYSGSLISMEGFENRQEGIIHLSRIPVLLKVAYSFHRGAERKKLERSRDGLDLRESNGFR